MTPAELVGPAAISDLEELLLGERIAPAPPVPEEFRARFRKFGPWNYGTIPVDPEGMYLLQYWTQALSDDLEPHVAFSHAGHGINSYALNLQLVDEHLALFAQVAWGGVYMDQEEQRRRASAMFAACHGLMATYRSWKRSQSGRSGRLLVIESELREAHVCSWVKKPFPTDGIADWYESQRRTGVDAITSALEWLEADLTQRIKGARPNSRSRRRS
jgi:hypothetical protein